MRTILLDSKCLQATQHLLGAGEPRRLSSFLAAISSLGEVRVLFSKGLPFGGPDFPAWARTFLRLWARTATRLFRWCCRPLGPIELRGCDLLILTTRFNLCPYSDSELDAIEAYVHAGGSLWLMANHSHVPGTRMGDFTTEDARLARRFGIQVLETCFRMPEGLAHLEVAGMRVHKILQDESGRRSIANVVVNNCCAIDLDSTTPVLWITNNMADDGPHGMVTAGLAFAITKSIGRGHVLVTGDSGFVCEPDVPGSGPGLFDHGDNCQFIVNAAQWLLGGK